MFRIVAVSNRLLCRGDFLSQLEAVAASGVWGLMLREKDLAEDEYTALARRAAEFCARHGTVLIVHGFSAAARTLGGWLHLPFPAFLRSREAGEDLGGFSLGLSVHSPEEARYAAAQGAAYAVAGHIFQTRSKPGPPRGLPFLARICTETAIPVYAIGGICEANIGAVRKAGAAGACLMSPFMENADPASYVKKLKAGAGDTGP